MKRAAIVIAVALGVGACARPASDVPSDRPRVGVPLTCAPSPFVPDLHGIPRFQEARSCERYVGYLIAAIVHQRFRSSSGVSIQDAYAGADAPKGYTTTNVQEAGVDEGDFLKTDGTHFFLLHGNTLQVLESWPAKALSRVAGIEIEGSPLSMVLHEHRLAIVSSVGGDSVRYNWMAIGRPFAPHSRLTVVDVSDPTKPIIERTIDMEAAFNELRMVNGRALVIGSRAVSLMRMDELVTQPTDERGYRDAIGRAITTTTFDEWLPSMLDSVTGERELMVDSFDAMYLPTVTGTVGIQAVVSVDLGHPASQVGKVALVSDSSLVYVATDALYVGYTDRWWWGDFSSPRTYLHRMRLDGEALPRYTGSVVVYGSVASPFWMSEHKGHLRVVSDGNGNRLQVYALADDADPDLVGAVTGFAPREDVTGVRFFGARAFVSTLLRVEAADPFFTFDLADPKEPKLVGALEMPGYTSYIHPLDDEHVLALGMFAASMGDPVTSVQTQIFDVSDFAHPVTADQYVVATGTGDGQTLSQALRDHHAFTYYEPLGIFAFPVSAYDSDWKPIFDGVVAMRVGSGSTLTELGRVDHHQYALKNDPWWSHVRRTTVIEGNDGAAYLYTFSNGAVMVHALGNLAAPIAVAVLPQYVVDDSGSVSDVYIP